MCLLNTVISKRVYTLGMTMQLRQIKRIKKAGLILFILIFPVMQLSGVMADDSDEETFPEPVISSELNDSSSHQVTRSSFQSQSVTDSNAATTIYFPIVRQAQSTPEQESGGEDVSFMNNEELAVLELVNIERVAAGCGPVEGQYHLRTAAYLHSKDMADNGYFSHTGLNGSRFWERAQDAGYDGFAAGENIAAGYRTPEAVMTGWMNSPGHRNNILNCSHTHLGVGYHFGSGSSYGAYWTQVFGQE